MAIWSAKEISAKIVVEKFVKGDVYRVIVIDGEMIAVAQRLPAIIVGDGVNSIKSLIEKYNEHQWRGLAGQKNTTLHKIEFDEKLFKRLEKSGVRVEGVLGVGQELKLADKVTLGEAAEIVNLTGQVHEKNKKLFEDVSRAMGMPFAGLDFICEDVAKPYDEQSFAFLENNTLPYIDMHHFPSIGEPINVAGRIWEYLLDTNDK